MSPAELLKKFRVGIPATRPKIPQGWKLRTSIFDYPAAISPDDTEWLIDVHGVLHEVRSTIQAATTAHGKPDIERTFTGQTKIPTPPYGTAIATP